MDPTSCNANSAKGSTVTAVAQTSHPSSVLLMQVICRLSFLDRLVPSTETMCIRTRPAEGSILNARLVDNDLRNRVSIIDNKWHQNFV